MQKFLENALTIGREYIKDGKVASYIPELSRADKNSLGICVLTESGERYAAGDTKTRFTIQSISKVISLAAALASSRVWIWLKSTPEYFFTASTMVIRSNGFPKSI